ncbi:MAG: TetR family transcriptional regulator [Pseudomonadota bacterium]
MRQQRGEMRRDAILRATWEVILRDGVRGVRHRAVAAAAGVPLSSTTYYFKDIQDLLVQSFELFAEESVERFAAPFWRQAEQQRLDFIAQAPAGSDSAEILAIAPSSLLLLDVAAKYIEERLTQHREQVVLEYAFWYAAIHEPRLQASVRLVVRRWIGLMLPWLSLLPVAQPEQAARSMLATVRRIEYEGLIGGSATESPSWVRDALMYQLKGLW